MKDLGLINVNIKCAENRFTVNAYRHNTDFVNTFKKYKLCITEVLQK